MHRQLAVVISIVFVLAGFSAASAQPSKDRDWTGQFATGIAWPQGDTSDILEDDWIFQGGATYRPPDWPVALSFELAWHEFDIERSILDVIGVDGGYSETWSVTANVNWPFIDRDGLEVYATGGVGYYDIEGKLTEDVLYTGWYCDPWYWWCYPTIQSGDAIIGEESWEEIGYNAGLGVSWDLNGGNQVYLESRYHTADLGNGDYDYLPVTIGFKF